jgi:hypothetical protein
MEKTLRYLGKEDSPSMLVPKSTIGRLIPEATEAMYNALIEGIQ